MFWIAGLGRSGTKWLAVTLNRSPKCTVKHEEADSARSGTPKYHVPFPLKRFVDAGPHYGEVHGHLLRYLSPYHPGDERMVPRRAVLLRDPTKIVESWMNRSNHELMDLPWITKTVIQARRQLIDYAASDPECRVLHMETLTGSLTELQSLVDWLELDFLVREEHLKPVNASKKRTFEWTTGSKLMFDRISRKFGYGTHC